MYLYLAVFERNEVFCNWIFTMLSKRGQNQVYNPFWSVIDLKRLNVTHVMKKSQY